MENIVRKSIKDTVRGNVETYCKRDNLEYPDLANLLIALGTTALVDWVVRCGGSVEELEQTMKATFSGLLEDCPILFEVARSLIIEGVDPDLVGEVMGNA